MKKGTSGWIEYSMRDLKAAEHLLSDEYVANSVLLHCHQAVEKIFKAALLEYNIKIPRIHGIIKLYNLLPDAYKDSLKIDTWHLTVLDEIYTDSRYPADIGILPSGFPSRDEAQKVYKIAQAIISDVLELIERYPFQ